MSFRRICLAIGLFISLAALQSAPGRSSALAIDDLKKTCQPATNDSAHSELFNPYSYYARESYATIYAHLDSVVAADFNGDGRNDVALVTSFQNEIYKVTENDGALFVFHQNNKGVLLEPVRYSTGFRSRTQQRSLAAGDVNGDNRADIVIGNTDSIEVFTQTAAGALERNAIHRTTLSFQVKTGDVNGDGRIDVVSAGFELGGTKIAVWRQNAQGQLNPPDIYDAPKSNGNEVDIGDLNSDGRKDIAVLNRGGFENSDVLVFLQSPDGRLLPPVAYQVDDQNCSGFAVGDVTGDGRDDLVVSFGGNRFNPPFPGIAVLTQNPGRTLDAPVKYDTLDVPQPVEIADINSDGRLDVVTVHYGWANVGAYEQGLDGRLLPEDLHAIPHNPNGQHVQGLAIADINNDGQRDVLVTDNYQRLLLLLYHATPCENTPEIAVTSPNGGESLTPGSTHNITWLTSLSIERVRIDYSIDGLNFVPIATAFATVGSVPWTVPDTGSSRAIIRIFDESFRAWDQNDAFFNIQSCRTTLTTIRQLFVPGRTGTGIVLVSTGANCNWQATKDVPWITFTTPSQGSGNGSVQFDVDGGTPPAVGTIRVGDASLQIVRAGNFTSVSAARYQAPVAPDSIVAGFGQKLATGTAGAVGTPLLTELLGTTVVVEDSFGVKRLASLFFVSPGQINYLMPAGTVSGIATVTVTSGDGSISSDPVFIQEVAYGVFSADAKGSGPAAAYVVRVKGGQQTIVPTVRYDEQQQKWVNVPIDLSKPDEEVVLVLFATGLRFRNSTIPVKVAAGIELLNAQYAGPQGQFVGLDQINVTLPRTLAGIGEVSLGFFVNQSHANSVTVWLQ